MNHLKDPPQKPIYGDHFTKASDSLFGRLLQTEVSAQPTYNCEQGIYCQWVSALKLAIVKGQLGVPLTVYPWYL